MPVAHHPVVVALRSLATLGMVAWAAQPVPALALPISVSQAYHYLDNRGPSNTGISSGERVAFGSTAVLPNGSAGTTGTASNADYLGGTPLGLFFQSQIVGGNEFALTLPAAIAPAGAWTLLFRNGADQTQAVTPDIVGATKIGFAQNVSISGTDTPTLRWAPTPGDPVNGVRLNFYDLNQRVNGLALLTHTVNLASATASQFTIPSAWNLQTGNSYSVEVSLIHTRDGSSNLAQNNLLSRSRSFFDFQLLNQAVDGPVYLPTVTPATASTPYIFSFNISGVSNAQTTFIDPLLAIGYDYKIGAGNPNFASVLLPQIGDNEYELYLLSGGVWSFARSVLAGQKVELGVGGVSEFRILGIETSAGIDPADATAFVTGLTFTANGSFTGTMTPLTVTVVPEPQTWALLLAGVGVLGMFRRRCPKAC